MPQLRRGMTLLELLVAIVIIGILLVLLLPAIQHSCEFARRTTCQNHLHQTALAIQSGVSNPRVVRVDARHRPRLGAGFRFGAAADSL